MAKASFFFFFNDTATTEIYTLSLHDALPILTRSKLADLWAAGNPTSYAGRSQANRLLMLNARYDLLLPRKFTEELWHTHGQPPIRRLPAGHTTAFLFGRTLVEEILGMIGPSVSGGAS